jgi:hypothetical protein
VFFTHPGGCAGCEDYARALAGRAAEIGEWGATAAVVVPGGREEPRPAAPGAGGPLEVLLDAEGRVAGQLGLRGAAVVIADEWGDVYALEDAGAGHELPSPQEVAEWVRYIAIQCPECEQPEGAWREID